MAGFFCRYKHAFGRVREGVHSLRVFDIAVVDVALTLLLCAFMAWALSLKSVLSISALVIGVFATAVVAHRVFCVKTAIDVALFG